MYLPDYLAAVFSEDKSNVAFPNRLELPYRMAVKYQILLNRGRKDKRE